MRVFLLGAGASKSYDQSPSGQRMPIARDFFEVFDQLPLSANAWVLIEGIIGYIEQEHGPDSAYRYLRSGIDIEDFHSRIEEARDAGLATGDHLQWSTPYRAYNELVFLFTAVLNEVQNGPVSRPHKNLVSQLNADDIVVTFNWDTLLDRALAEATAWRPDWGYGVKPREVFDGGWRPTAELPEGSWNPLIKLHGSTNWLTSYSVTDGQGKITPTQDLDPSAFAVFVQSTKPYACFAGRYMGGYAPYSYGYYPPNLEFPGRAVEDDRMIVSIRPKFPWREEETAPDDGLPSMPLLIPPVKHKSYEYFGDLFRTLWSSAENALAAADEIVIIGYSFPRTDVQSDELFRRAFTRRLNMPHVSILDPAPDAVGNKFTQDLGITGDHLRVVRDYFTSTFDLAGLLQGGDQKA